MKFIWKRTSVFIWLIVFGFVFPLQGVFAEDVAAAGKTEAAKPAAVTPEATKPARSIVVTYFHNTMRCPTCHKIEEQSTQAVKFHFEKELLSGEVVFRVINVDEPANEHYNTDYQLYTKSLIVSELKDGKEVRWKNLEKIWELVRDEEEFDKYVQDEINDWLKE